MSEFMEDHLEDTKVFNYDNPSVLESSKESDDELNHSLDETFDETLDETVPNVANCLQIILHQGSHAGGEKPYICDYKGCKKAFSKPGLLCEHKKRNHDELDETLVEKIPNVTGGPDGYKCRKCNVFFPKYQMVLHLRSHTGEKPHLCDYPGCNKAFARPGTLSEHKKRNHEKLLQHICPICGKKFYERCVMLQHIVIHDEARQTQRFFPPQMMELLTQVEEFNYDGQVVRSKCVCEGCGKIFVNGSGKNRHVKGGQCRKYKCLNSGCGKSYFAESGLAHHSKECHHLMSTISVPKTEKLKLEMNPEIKCEGSDEYTVDIKKENIFMEEHCLQKSNFPSYEGDIKMNEYQNPNKELLYPCDLCGNSLGSKESLDIHKTIHEEINRFKCMEKNCEEVFTTQNSLSKHLVSVHQIEDKTENGPFYVCEQCGKQCTTKGGLKDHTRSHSTEKKYICMVCGKKLKRSSTLTMHMKIHTGEKDFQCDKCESSFVSSAGLRNHTLSKHTDLSDAPQFICSYCGKSFPKKDYLLKHVTEHTGEKNYKCSVCGKCFRHETTLTSHLDMHYGIKKFPCPHCGKRFTQRQQMNMHVRRHTGDKRHKCNICGEAFIEPRSLRNHTKRYHEEPKHEPPMSLAGHSSDL